MKITFPLSLKISLWLLLNLLLVGGAALGFFFAQGGWDAIVRGPAGGRLQQLAESLGDEYAAAASDARPKILDRYRAAYGATFLVLHPDLPRPAQALPAEVDQRARRRPPGPARRREDGSGFPPPGPGGAGRDDPGPPEGRPGGARDDDESRGRFLVRAGDPPAYWLGARTLLGSVRRPEPALVVARVDSWWGVLRLLDLQPWLLAVGAVLAFSLIFWLPLVGSITRALRRLTGATGAIAEGRFDTRVPDGRRDELGSLGRSVNRMAERLDTLVNGQRRFLGDAAHELGSPLGRLQVAVEILESRADPALRPAIADVREEVEQMSALVNELLAFTKAGLHPRGAALGTVELAPLATRVLAREDPRSVVYLEVADGLRVHADEQLLERALGNLVRNALRYAAGAGPVTVAASRAENAEIVLTVADAGPGVPPESLARLGEPFYRPEAARTREGGGTGLGLAIVKSCVEACRDAWPSAISRRPALLRKSGWRPRPERRFSDRQTTKHAKG
jgi:two-component system sensor histidine kinase CpxA